MISLRMKNILAENEYLLAREIDGLGICAIRRFLFTYAIVCGIDDVGYSHRYCYETAEDCMSDYDGWSGIGHPAGNWIKRKGNNEQINPAWMRLNER